MATREMYTGRYLSLCLLLLLSSWRRGTRICLPCQALSSSLEAAHRAKIASSIAKSERRASERAAQSRERCGNCHRPMVQCLCDAVPKERISLDRTEVLVLQHPTEFRRNTISTVPLLSLVLENVQVAVGRNFDLSTRAIRYALEQNYTLALLYPSPDAIDLDNPTTEQQELLGMTTSARKIDVAENSPDQPILQSKTLVIACDGTWTQAKRMFNNSPELVEKCHLIQFTSNTTTVYDRIRTEPDDHCLSTAEAVAETLIRLEPNKGRTAKEYIHAALNRLVEVQLRYSPERLPEAARFVSRKQKVLEKRRKRLDLEQSLFQDSRESFDLGDGTILRPLDLDDVPYISHVNDNRSIHMIADLIRFHPPFCLGIERNERLIACILRYRTGEIGLLHVDDDHRRKGYASILIQELVQRIRRSNGNKNSPESEGTSFPVETYIVDGNEASQAVFRSLGWKPEQENVKKGTGRRKAKRKWIYVDN